MKYDFLIVGAGLFGAVFAREAHNRGKKCLVVEKRANVGGNCYTEVVDGITVHRYGAHIFHTSDEAVWNYVNKYAHFNPFINCPLANYMGKLYHLPFNMNTFYELWGTATPQKAREKIAQQIVPCENPKNVREQALALVGTDIYKTLIEGYTEKQWGRSADKLPADIIKRLPLRFTFDNNYFNDVWQGIPEGGYTALVNNLLQGIEVRTGVDYLSCREQLDALADKVVYTGAIDEFFGYSRGNLEYRSLRFETQRIETESFQGNAVINYTERNVRYTRIIEHKHFARNVDLPYTIVTYEYPAAQGAGDERYYPVNDATNNIRYCEYKRLADRQEKVIFGGRLGLYKYLDMDDVISEALKLAQSIL